MTSKLFENIFTLSAHNLGSQNKSLENKKQQNLFIELIDVGVINIDTADSYSNTQSERELAKILKARPNIKITSKTGAPFLKLTNPVGKILNDSKFVQKSRQVIFGNTGDFDPTLNPEGLKLRIEGTLRRLKIEGLHTYLLHHLPPRSIYDDCIDELIKVKERGLTEKIGIALSDAGETNLNWADEVLIPIDLFEKTKAYSTRISVHGLFRKNRSNWSIALDQLLNDDHFHRVFCHTEKLEHLTMIKKYFDRYA